MARDKKTVKNRTETIITDHKTGEVLSQESTVTYKVPQEPDFVKVYIESFTDMGLRDHHVTLLFQLVRKMNYENVIALTPGARVRIGEKLKIQQQTFRNYLAVLLEADIFRRIGHGEFMVNPTYIAKARFEENVARQKIYYKIKQVKTKKGRTPKPKEVAPDT
jgi:hypothetical protein